jgi:hypothetical protein
VNYRDTGWNRFFNSSVFRAVDWLICAHRAHVTGCHAMMIEQKQQRPLVGDFGGVMAEATHRVLPGRNRHRADEGMHRKPGRSPLAALD